MAKNKISVPDYLVDMSADQLEYIAKLAIEKAESIKGNGRMTIITPVSTTCLDTPYFYQHDIRKAIEYLRDCVNADLAKDDLPSFPNYQIKPVVIWRNELADYGLKPLHRKRFFI